METCLCEPSAKVAVFVRKSVHTECQRDEAEHKWIASEKAGHDLGEAAIWYWLRTHWHGYLRARWVEHLQGKYFWIELEDCDFGLLLREFHDQQPLLDEILGRLSAGEENLNVICSVVDQGYDPDKSCQIIEILTALDVNSARLRHRFEQPPPASEPHIISA